MHDFLPIIAILGIGQGLFLSIALIIKRKNLVPNRILAVLIILFSLELLQSYIYHHRGYFFLPNYLLIIDSFGFAYGPLIYLYVGLLTSHIKELRLRHFWHFIPFFIYLIQTLSFYTLSYQQQSDLIHTYFSRNTPSLLVLIDSLVYLVMLFYIIWIIKVLNSYSNKIKTYFSDLEKIKLIWLRAITFLILVSWSAALLAFILFYFNQQWSRGLEQIFYLAVTLYIYVIGYFSLLQPEIFSKTHHMVEAIENISDSETGKTNETKTVAEKYAKTKLSEKLLETYFKKIIQYTEASKLYLNPELTIQELSDNIKIPAHYISQTINLKLNKNFYHFINHYRIEEAKIALSQEKVESILEIAFNVGFNSKATFNSVFKKYTGKTPTEFRKKT